MTETPADRIALEQSGLGSAELLGFGSGDPVRGIIVDDVKAWLRLDDDADDDLLGDVVAATNAWVAHTPYVHAIAADPEVAWPDDVLQGAVMLAARLYRRRNTPGGVEAFGADVVYVPRRDADVTAMLHLAAPRVG